MKLFYNVHRINEEKEWKNFILVPMFKHKLHHIRYDDSGLHETLRALKLSTGQVSTFNRDDWFKYFDIRPLETAQHKFNYSVSTDGVSISFTMSRDAVPKKTKEELDTKIKEKLKSGKYGRKIGLDPGFVLMIGGVAEDSDGGNRSLIKFRSTQFRAMSGEFSRRRHRLKICKTIDDVFNPEAAKFPQKSPKNYKHFTAFRLKFFKQKQDAYGKRSIARLR